MARRSKHTIRIPLKLSDFVLTMTNNKNKQKEGVIDYDNEDSSMKSGDMHVNVDDKANGGCGDEDSVSSSEYCAAENEFSSLNEMNKQHEGGNNEEKNEVGEGSGSKNIENEKCKGAKTTSDQGLSNSVPVSFADVTRTNQSNVDNTLSLIPICIKEGREVVVFDEELVIKGSRKWELTLCGHFVGCRMSYLELRYNLVRMWSKFGLKDIVSQNGVFLFKFREDEGMKSEPWMVNNKPLMIQKWDPSVIIDKKEPVVLPYWIKLLNVPCTGNDTMAIRVRVDLIQGTRSKDWRPRKRSRAKDL
ncbi:RNA-directed DNA polymerase, eukaryota, reverse transcriptase zinc-binding domain protein [Tanacetum coccineum]